MESNQSRFKMHLKGFIKEKACQQYAKWYQVSLDTFRLLKGFANLVISAYSMYARIDFTFYPDERFVIFCTGPKCINIK